jgi:hypothetical protein
MDDQPGGLVDYCEMLVLEQNLEWNRRRSKGAGRLGIRKPDVDSIGAGEKSGGSCSHAVDGDGAVGD